MLSPGAIVRKFLDPISFETTSKFHAVVYSSILALLYVGSLYMNKSPFPRDHPTTVLKRFKGVLFASLTAPVLVFLWSDGIQKRSNASYNVFHWLGVHTNSICAASFLPLVLTMVLFLGPIMQLIFNKNDDEQVTHRPNIPLKTKMLICFNDIVWWRNFVVAPLTEEFVFRACMLPFLVPAFGCHISVLLCPAFFGIAHVHHAIEGVRMGLSLQTVLIRSVFQMAYTTVFGAYTAFLFLRTGHLLGPVLCHAFCNFMGFPEFDRIAYSSYPKTVAVSFVVGLLCFSLALFPLTDPAYFSSIYWNAR